MALGNFALFLLLAMAAPRAKACFRPVVAQSSLAVSSAPTLLDAFREEQKIYGANFTTYRTSDWNGYRNNDPLRSYRNFIYPSRLGQPLPKDQSRNSLIQFYGEAPGLVIHTGGRSGNRYAEKTDYLLLEPENRKQMVCPSGIRIETSEDVDLVARTILQGFESSIPFTDYRDRMKSLFERLNTRSLIAYCDNKVCGVHSVARTSSDYEFGIGLAVLPAFRDRGIAKLLVAKMSEGATTRMLEHAGNPISSHVFQSLGFTLLGETELIDVLDLPQ